MLNKLQFHLLKKLYIPSFLANTKSHSFPSSTQKRLPLHIPKNYSFSTSNFNKDFLLQGISLWKKEELSQTLDKYAAHKENLAKLASDDIQSILSGLIDLSRDHLQASSHLPAYDCLSEIAHIFQKLGIKDTIDVARNYYEMSSILIEQQKFEKAEKYLSEVNRICNLLDQTPQAKSLKVQSWFLLAQAVESKSSQQDKALELYHQVLENLRDVSESALPTVLPSLHQAMGRIYLSRNDADNMFKSYENAVKSAIKYDGQNSPIDLNFLKDILDDPVLKAKYSSQNPIKMALDSFQDPYEKVGVICCLIGNIYLANRKFRQAVDSYNQAFKIFEEKSKDDSSLLYDIYFSMSQAQRALSNDNLASHFVKKAEGAIANAKQNFNTAAAYERWARICSRRLDPFGTEDYYKKAIEIYKALDPGNKAKIFEIYEEWGEIVESLYWGLPVDADFGSEKVVEVWKEAEKYLDTTDHPTVQKLYIYLEFAYYQLMNYEESEKCVQKILESCEATGDTSFAFDSYYQTGEALEQKGDLRPALPCYETAARIYEKETNKDPVKAENLDAKISQIKEELKAMK